MALIDKDQIRAEIERRKDLYKRTYSALHPDDLEASISYGQARCMDELLDFLDTLPEQEPQGLDEAANEFANQDCVTFISRKKGFIAGAEWMAGQGITAEAVMQYDDVDDLVPTLPNMENYEFSVGDKVIVQIRKKDEQESRRSSAGGIS